MHRGVYVLPWNFSSFLLNFVCSKFIPLVLRSTRVWLKPNLVSRLKRQRRTQTRASNNLSPRLCVRVEYTSHDPLKHLYVRGPYILHPLKKISPRNYLHTWCEEMGALEPHFCFRFPCSISSLVMFPEYLHEGNYSVAQDSVLPFYYLGGLLHIGEIFL